MEEIWFYYTKKYGTVVNYTCSYIIAFSTLPMTFFVMKQTLNCNVLGVAKSVTAFAVKAEVWVFEFQPQQGTKALK